jgi:large subunit ribosomal protein L15
MRLNQLSDNDGAHKDRKRVGRGCGSGTGKTAGRGVKGQKSRSGVAIKGFEGGQMPIHRRLPKRGFKNIFSKNFNEVNIGRIQVALDAGKLDGKKAITVDAMLEAGIIRRINDGVRLLGKGELKGKVALEVTGASKGAIEAVEKAGGSVNIVELARPEPVKSDKPKTKGKSRVKSTSAKDAGKSKDDA